jgi:hypothetical protein
VKTKLNRILVHIINLNTFSYRESVLKGENVFAKNVQKSACVIAAMMMMMMMMMKIIIIIIIIIMTNTFIIYILDIWCRKFSQAVFVFLSKNTRIF